MKKLTLSLVAAGLVASSLGAYAALPTMAAPFQVVIPNLKSGLELTLEGLYLKPSNSNLAYGVTQPADYPNAAFAIHYLDPKYGFGFRAGLGYVFPDSGNDVQLSWTHFNHSDDDAASQVDSGVTSHTFSTDVDFKYNAVDLDVGQFVSVGTRLQTRLFMGLRGAELRMDTTNVDTDHLYPNSSVNSVANSKFIGIGPRVGVDASYHVGNCFGIVGHFATALLVGNVDANGTVSHHGEGPISETYTLDTQTRVVPAFDAKLGVNYTVEFKNAEASSLNIEAGYQVTHYVDAIDNVRFNSDRDASVVTSSLGFHGPYLSLNFKI